MSTPPDRGVLRSLVSEDFFFGSTSPCASAASLAVTGLTSPVELSLGSMSSPAGDASAVGFAAGGGILGLAAGVDDDWPAPAEELPERCVMGRIARRLRRPGVSAPS